MPSFGPKGRAPVPAKLVPFDFTVLRDDEPETHHFQAREVTDIASFMVTLTASEKHPEHAMVGLMRMIAKMLYNKDGVPAQWKPTPLKPKDPLEGNRNQVSSAIDALAGDELCHEADEEPKIRDPLTGEIVDAAPGRIAELTAFEAGSSRRRWLHLMEVDDEVIVQTEDLMALFKWLVGLAAGRPT